jgi:hypothetical protein
MTATSARIAPRSGWQGAMGAAVADQSVCAGCGIVVKILP